MLRRVKVDPVTRSRLGRSTLAGVRARLWAIDCQTCGRPLRGGAPSLTVDRTDELAVAMLHHRQCREPGWFDGPWSAGLPTLSWRSATFLWKPHGMPVFLVNPSCEATMLRRTDTGWLGADLDSFRAAGFADTMVLAQVAGLVATVEPGRLTVDFAAGAHGYSWSCEVGPAVASAIDGLATVLVAVSTRVDPTSGITLEELVALLLQRDAVVGVADVRFTPEVQRPRADDFDRDVRDQVFALQAEALHRAPGIEVGDRHLIAALAACDGDNRPVEALTGRDQEVALLMVAGLYSMHAQTESEAPLSDEGAHVLVPDEDTARRLHDLFHPMCATLGVRCGLLPGPGYDAEMVIGTPDQFAAARSSSPVRRGRLAITVGVGNHALDRYRRVLSVGAARSTGVVDRLMRERIIILGSELDDAAANRLTAQLLLLEAEDPAADITFYINSAGGSVSAGMAVLDTMKLVKPDVATWTTGLAAGMAQVLLSAGAPGKRHALPDARVILTRPKGPPNPTKEQREALATWTRTVIELTAADTGQPVERVRDDIERERAFSAAEAVEYGLVDGVGRPTRRGRTDRSDV